MEKTIMSSFVSSMDESFVHEGMFSEDDLSYWEFINSSDTQSDDDVISLDDSSMSSSSAPKIDAPVEDHSDHRDCGNQEGGFNGDQVGVGAGADVKHGDLRYGEEEENVEEEEEDGFGYGLDDELVPWAVSGKFGRQRMRKLGKRSFSKQSRYSYVKPGCVRGKHGLGLKHSV